MRKVADLRQGRGPPARVPLVRRKSGDSGGRYLYSSYSGRGAPRGRVGAFRPRRAGPGAAARERRGRCARRPRARSRLPLTGARWRPGDPMTAVDSLLAKAKDRTAIFGVVGLGCVGLPLALELVRARYRL